MDTDAPGVAKNGAGNMNKNLIDQVARARFCAQLDRNFSVVASAGSGKTRALTDRIVAIARSAHALDWLPRLVVVTYTNRAANEMQQRARQEILRAKVGVDVLSAFNRAFFGTIHSFCVKLLSAHGHHLGLPGQLELIKDDDELWNDFVQRQEKIGRGLSDEARAVLLRHVEVRKLMELGRAGKIVASENFSDKPCTDVDVSALLQFEPKYPSIETVSRTQAELRTWDRLRREGADFVPIPLRHSDAKDFRKLWCEAFGPFQDWLNRAALCVAAEVGRDYRQFRLTRGTLTYDDQVALALELFRHPEAARRIRNRDYRVILDEAQDTGPGQFGVLLETARHPDAQPFWPNESSDPPRPGHFCMVGDFQQSIFSQHADLPFYRRVHDALVAAPGGESVEFSVSFRLDQKSIDLINESFREILTGDGQVSFLNMQARPDVLPGQVLRVDFPHPPTLTPRTPVRRKAGWEAGELARWIRHAGLQNLRAKTWRDVAILCPRKAWFRPLWDALREENLSAEIQSETDVKGDHPAYAWLTALLVVMTDPDDTYEIVGVLREIFGLSDHDLATFAKGDGWRFGLRRENKADDPVSAKLRLLGQIRSAIIALPLFTAVEEIIRTVQLRERLRSLPEKDFDSLDEELDRLLAMSAEAEAAEWSLADFARHLRDDFEAAREPAAARNEDAIQLITSHKAKGSEWQAVIVPFLTREVDFFSPRYPRLITTGPLLDQRVLFDRTEVTSELKEELNQVQIQEMERLLYVALSRARHTLVLACAPELYPSSKGKVPEKSQMKWLRCESGGCNEETFARLSAEARACEQTHTQQEKMAAEETKHGNVSKLAKPSPVLRQAAQKRAGDFIRKINPSGFAENFETQPSGEVEPLAASAIRAGAFDDPATRYGRWWHTLLQRLNWAEDFATWNEIFETTLPEAPDQKRAKAEWKLFRAHVAGTDDFRKQFGSDRFHARAEIPFLLKVKSSFALEGIIDLALIDPKSKRGLIIDWKTNRIARSEIETLHARYRPQIAAYWKAMIEISGLKMQAALYSTSAGSLSLYEDRELEREWARLEKLPPSQVTEEISPV
jgi:ATP-dependent helicase/nuclease subunit A